MATGAGFGGLVTALMPLVGIVAILASRRKRRRGRDVTDEEFERRQVATAEVQRRMAAYLAGRDTGRGDVAPADGNEQENGR